MVNLKTLVLGAGLGLVPRGADGQDGVADGQDIKVYDQATQQEITYRFKKSVIQLNNDTYKTAMEYAGATVLILDNICEGSEYEGTDANVFEINLGLQEKFKNKRVNNLPIRFAYFDACEHGTDVVKVNDYGVPFETRLIISGTLIDRSLGTQQSHERILNSIEAGSAWISTNLLNIPFDYNGKKVRWRYDSSGTIHSVPF
jgi:hypothetical protein